MYQKLFESNGFHYGRLVSQSKSDYRQKYPDNDVYFNANIFILGEGKVWYGDLDLTRDLEKLKTISSEIGKPLFVLREMDGRFDSSELQDPQIIKRAVGKIEI